MQLVTAALLDNQGVKGGGGLSATENMGQKEKDSLPHACADC